MRTRALAMLAWGACGRLGFDAVDQVGSDAGTADAPTAIMAVQTTAGSSSNADASLEFSQATRAGDTLIVCFTFSSGSGALVSIEDMLNNAYSVVVGPVVSNGFDHYIAAALSASDGKDVVTVTLSTAVSGWNALAFEYAGLASTDPEDTAAYDSGDGSAMTSGSVSTSWPHELLLAYGHSTNPGVGSGYTLRGSAQDSLVEDHIVFSTGIYSATAMTTPGIWTLILVGFIGASSGD